MTTSDPRPEGSGGPTGFDSRAFEARAQSLGRELDQATRSFTESPAVQDTAVLAGRVMGVILLAVGAWFLADVTLGLDLPGVAWRDLWPLALIAFGLVFVLRGALRRSA
jgi:hypothetical protein